MQRYDIYTDFSYRMFHEESADGEWVRYDDAQAEITSLTEERDQALARAAAAAMEMRERAADLLQTDGELAELIRALPIDPDAQKALDQLLAKAREDAIREAAAVSGHYMSDEADELLLDMWREDILALLNDGGRDE